MIEFRMPSLGADMDAGTLVEWLKKPGDAVARGDIIAVVDTEKGAIEIEVFADGVIDRTAVEPGAKVPVETVLDVEELLAKRQRMWLIAVRRGDKVFNLQVPG